MCPSPWQQILLKNWKNWNKVRKSCRPNNRNHPCSWRKFHHKKVVIEFLQNLIGSKALTENFYQFHTDCYSRLNFNSLAPGKFELNFRYIIFQIISVIDGWGISFELALGWMLLDLADDKSTLVQVMAWYRQATSHYLSQCWPRSLSPYGVTRPQWVNQ